MRRRHASNSNAYTCGVGHAYICAHAGTRVKVLPKNFRSTLREVHTYASGNDQGARDG